MTSLTKIPELSAMRDQVVESYLFACRRSTFLGADVIAWLSYVVNVALRQKR